MRVWILLAIVVLAGTAGEISVTRAMKRIGEVHQFNPRALLKVLGRAFRIGWMWLGLALLAMAFFSLLALLSWENVSFVVPLTALSYVVGALMAKLFLKEKVDRIRWMGVLLVVVGVVLVWVG
ncbi:MAG TPA: EamA family transporter [Candidatus Dormibacteraeota bacterium]|nr:EamA family transporter [Candidatus Dormibacteraeota bacterium]